MIKRFGLYTLVFLCAVSCAGKKYPVSLQEDGSYRLQYVHSDEQASKQKSEALAAKHCARQNKAYMLLNSETTYSGSLTEEAAKTVRKVGQIGTIFGVGDAENASAIATEDSQYTTLVSFRCR